MESCLVEHDLCLLLKIDLYFPIISSSGFLSRHDEKKIVGGDNYIVVYIKRIKLL